VGYRGDTSLSANEVNATQEGRVMRLRGYGNAIVVPLASEFIRAYMDACGDHVADAGKMEVMK
jgi:hypothetical protein